MIIIVHVKTILMRHCWLMPIENMVIDWPRSIHWESLSMRKMTNRSKMNSSFVRSLIRSIPELDSKNFSSNFQIHDAQQAKLLCAFDLNDESLPKTRDQWMEKLNQIYCQSISLECEFIEVSVDHHHYLVIIFELEWSWTFVGRKKIRTNPFVLNHFWTDTSKNWWTNA